MSGVNPGGHRAGDGVARVFGARQIERLCDKAKVPDIDRANGSPAGKPHKNSREVERRLRQQARKAKP